jgi:hypothetical protein
LHGGGQGFDSPRLHSRSIWANTPDVGEDFTLSLFRGVEPLITIVVVR